MSIRSSGLKQYFTYFMGKTTAWRVFSLVSEPKSYFSYNFSSVDVGFVCILIMGFLKKFLLALVTLIGVSTIILYLVWIRLGFEYIPFKVQDLGMLQNVSYDFIIGEVKVFDIKSTLSQYNSIAVGAGTAGSVLANRLSANSNVSVLLVEAGDVFGAASIVPLFSTAMQQTKYDWAFRTTPQKYSSHGLINNVSLPSVPEFLSIHSSMILFV